MRANVRTKMVNPSKVPAPPASAAERTFGVTELAEQIFLDLPPRTILVVIQRTCKQFKAVVEGSKPLRQALFFEPISSLRLQLANCYKTSRCTGFWINHKTMNHGCASKGDSYCIWMHPMIRRIAENDSEYEARCEYPSASWRKQLASQPPMVYCRLLDGNYGGKEVFPAARSGRSVMLQQIAKLSTKTLRNEEHIHLDGLGFHWHDKKEDWAWGEMPAGELLKEIEASAENHDGDADCTWCNSAGHNHSSSTVARREEWRKARGF